MFALLILLFIIFCCAVCVCIRIRFFTLWRWCQYWRTCTCYVTVVSHDCSLIVMITLLLWPIELFRCSYLSVILVPSLLPFFLSSFLPSSSSTFHRPTTALLPYSTCMNKSFYLNILTFPISVSSYLLISSSFYHQIFILSEQPPHSKWGTVWVGVSLS